MKKIGLDVRTAAEIFENPAPGSLHIQLSDLPNEVESKISEKTAEVLVFCEKGGRAEKAKDFLVGLGYTNVTNFGSWREWNESLKD